MSDIPNNLKLQLNFSTRKQLLRTAIFWQKHVRLHSEETQEVESKKKFFQEKHENQYWVETFKKA